MKFILSFGLIFTLASFIFANPVKYEERKPGDKLLYRAHVVRPAIKGISQDVYVAYPREGEVNRFNVITSIYTYNELNEDFGSTPVLAYGVEKNFTAALYTATVILRGYVSKGIDAKVEFYGY